MAAIINALFGTYPDVEQQNNTTNQTTVDSNSTISVEHLSTSAVADDVQVRSTISTETQANATLSNKLNINNLLSQLSTTHSQVDQYSRARTAQINDQVQKSIANVLANTQRQQEALLVDANRRHQIIDNEYKIQLQRAVEALDGVKAKTLGELERDLQAQQQGILAEAKREIDVLNDQANAAKLHALVEAQEQARQDISNLADQVGVLGQQETQNLLQSTTTTIITSQSQATGTVEAVVVAPVTQTSVIITEQHQVNTNAVNNNSQVAVLSPSDLVLASTVPVGTQNHTTAFGTVTGASDLTTTPATVVATTTNLETEIKSPQDNTNF